MPSPPPDMTPMIAGITAGGVCGFLVLLIVCYYAMRRMRRYCKRLQQRRAAVAPMPQPQSTELVQPQPGPQMGLPVAEGQLIAINSSNPKIKQLRTLKELFDSGALTDAEFRAEKATVLEGGIA